MYPEAYLQYLVHFHSDRDFFECHEILEEYWKRTDPANKNSIWVAFIQLAVSTYHHRRGNYNGAEKTLEKAIKIYSIHEEAISKLGLEKMRFLSLVKERLSLIKARHTYTCFNLPFSDLTLQKKCLEMAEKAGFKWGSENFNMNIVNKHLIRDRTDVILEREKALRKKKRQQS